VDASVKVRRRLVIQGFATEPASLPPAMAAARPCTAEMPATSQPSWLESTSHSLSCKLGHETAHFLALSDSRSYSTDFCFANNRGKAGKAVEIRKEK